MKPHIHKKTITMKNHVLNIKQSNKMNKFKDIQKSRSIKDDKITTKNSINQMVRYILFNKRILDHPMFVNVNRIFFSNKYSLQDAILHVIQCLIKIKNSNIDWKNSMICVINILMKMTKYKDKKIDCVKIFDLVLETQKMEIIHLIDWENTDCTLSHLVNSVILLTRGNLNKKKERFILNLIDLMIQKGIRLDNSLTDNNTFSLALQSKNLNLITKILEPGPLNICLPKNLPKYILQDELSNMHMIPRFYPSFDQYTLNHAIKTRNLEIVKIAINNNATCDYIDEYHHNSLILAIETYDPHIVFQIIAHGKFENCEFDMGDRWYYTNMLNNFNFKFDSNKFSDLNSIINLVMCSGIIINFLDFKKLKNENLIESKLKMCGFLKIPIHLVRFSPRMKEELSITMDELIHRPRERDEILTLLNQRLKMIPRCLIDIIFEYHWLKSSVKFIDWMNI